MKRNSLQCFQPVSGKFLSLNIWHLGSIIFKNNNYILLFNLRTIFFLLRWRKKVFLIIYKLKTVKRIDSKYLLFGQLVLLKAVIVIVFNYVASNYFWSDYIPKWTVISQFYHKLTIISKTSCSKNSFTL